MKCSNCGTQFEGNFCPHCGAPAQQSAQAQAHSQSAPVTAPQQQLNPEPNNGAIAQATTGESRFTGGAFANFGINFVTSLVTIITLTLAYPAMLCWKMRWEVRHTYINGRQLSFDGKAHQLYGKYILWLFLSIITLGIYYLFCMSINLEKWRTKHTHISGVQGRESKFTGGALGYFAVNFICNFVTLITLTLGMYWARCYKERWFAKHTVIDGLTLKFTGKGIQYFAKCIVWILLTVITLGIYSFWLAVKVKNWITQHTIFAEGQALLALDSATPAAMNNTQTVQARGPEYWGDLEKEFITPENIKAANQINNRGLRLATLIISLILTVLIILSTASAALSLIVVSFNYVSYDGAAANQVNTELLIIGIAFATYTFVNIVLFIAALCNARGSFARFNENTTLKQIIKARKMTILLTITSIFFEIYIIGIVLLVFNIISASRLKNLKNTASAYFTANGVSKNKLKNQPLGEFYFKLDKCREYVNYNKYVNTINQKH